MISWRAPTRAQAITARAAAVEEVERLLQFPEDLKRLPSLREEYAVKQQASEPRRWRRRWPVASTTVAPPPPPPHDHLLLLLLLLLCRPTRPS